MHLQIEMTYFKDDIQRRFNVWKRLIIHCHLSNGNYLLIRSF